MGPIPLSSFSALSFGERISRSVSSLLLLRLRRPRSSFIGTIVAEGWTHSTFVVEGSQRTVGKSHIRHNSPQTPFKFSFDSLSWTQLVRKQKYEGCIYVHIYVFKFRLIFKSSCLGSAAIVCMTWSWILRFFYCDSITFDRSIISTSVSFQNNSTIESHMVYL